MKINRIMAKATEDAPDFIGELYCLLPIQASQLELARPKMDYTT